MDDIIENGTSVLLVGYNGANNTGAEALLLSDIEDVRAVLGPKTRITVPSLAPELVEGSTYMDTWGSVVLWAFLWSTHCAARMGKRSLAYAVDAGSLSRLNRWLLDTPAILQRSGIACDERLFVDPVLCLAGRREGTGPRGEISMPFVVQGDSYSFFYNRQWRRPGSNILSLMVKLADDGEGGSDHGRVRKQLTAGDREKLSAAVAVCREMLLRLGVEEKSLVLGTVNAGHPGGMLPLTWRDAASLHPARLPDNLSVADACLLPRSLGNPPILTIMALSRAIGRKVKEAAA